MATISDVAKLAGLSVGTVSRVFNNKGYISEEARTKVLEASKALGYYPSEVARSLQRMYTNVIGVIVPYISHPFFAALVQALEQECWGRGYRAMLCTSNHETAKEREYAEMLTRNKVDGIVVCSRTQEVQHYIDTKLPIVSIERTITSSIPAIVSDNEEGGIIAADALLDRGCIHPAIIGWKPDVDAAHMLSPLRGEAFVRRCRERDVEVNVIDIPSETDENTTEIIAQKLTSRPELDGIFATGDVYASCAATACERILGRRIPEDIQIVGYDNTNIAVYCGLSCVAQPIEKLAKYAISTLANMISGEVAPSRIVLPVSFIERRSTRKI